MHLQPRLLYLMRFDEVLIFALSINLIPDVSPKTKRYVIVDSHEEYGGVQLM